MPNLFPLLLIVHIVLAISLFLPSILLPFALRTRRAAVDSRQSRRARACSGLQSHGTLVIGLGLAVTGLGLVALLGSSLLPQPWLLWRLAIYAVNLVLAFFVQRPEPAPARRRDRRGRRRVWEARARRQRYVSYVMAALIGTIGFLMSAKPILW